MDQTDPVTEARAALAVIEQELVAVGVAAKVASDNLHNAARGTLTDVSLPELRHRREMARAEVTAAEKRRDDARKVLEAAEAAQRAAEEQARREEQAAVQRAAAEQAARELAARLEGPLVALADARKALDAATSEIGQSLTDPTVAAARVKAMVMTEQLVTAIDAVADIDPRHPSIAPARAQMQAAQVHGVLADLAPALADLAAARAALSAAHTKIVNVIAAHPGRDVVRLVMALAALDAVAGPPLSPDLAHALGWLGFSLTKMEAERFAVGLLGSAPLPNVQPSELAALVLAGRGHEAGEVSQKRERAAQLRALADATTTAQTLLGRARAASAEMAHGRVTGDWIRAGREEELRALLSDAAETAMASVRSQIERDPRLRLGPFKVPRVPGEPPVDEIDQGRQQQRDPASGTYYPGPPKPVREQLAHALGLEGPLVDLAALVPEVWPQYALQSGMEAA